MRGFRAWHTKLNRYLKDDEFYIRCDGKVCADADGPGYEEAFDTIDFDNGYIIREDDTGFKDKNGKKIYDGDILDNGIHICKIKWSEHFTAFEALNEYEGYKSKVWFEAKYGEVIGNVHDNPELLKESK